MYTGVSNWTWKSKIKLFSILLASFVVASCGGGTETLLSRGSQGDKAVVVSSEIVSYGAEECPYGGITLYTGIDTDGDGLLDDFERDNRYDICHGVDGGDGGDGLTALLTITPMSPEEAALYCDGDAGQRIDTGLDSDRDGVLDTPDEVTAQSYVCNGTTTATVVAVVNGVSAPGTPTDAGAFINSTRLTFDWTAATDTYGGGVEHYNLQVGLSAGNDGVFSDPVGNVLTYDITGPLNGHTFYARVQAVTADGRVGPWSANSDGIRVDTVAPTVGSVTPADNEIDVSTDIVITVIFADRVKETTINATTFTVVETLSGDSVAGTIETNPYAAFFTPTSRLVSITSYTVTVTSGVTDRAGNALAPGETWNFITHFGF